MKKEEIVAWDWQRILFGQAPVEFLFEVLLRTVFIYLLLLVILRLLGKRMDGQLTLTEMAVVITMGAIVSVPMQLPDRGILPGVVALLCAAAFQRGLNWLNVKSRNVEEISQGTLSTLVRNGVLVLDEMTKAGISKQNLFESLRTENIVNLGSVKRVYFEACGIFSVYRSEGKTPGLPLLPGNELELVLAENEIANDMSACTNCGFVQDRKPHEAQKCNHCGEDKWVEAIY